MHDGNNTARNKHERMLAAEEPNAEPDVKKEMVELIEIREQDEIPCKQIKTE